VFLIRTIDFEEESAKVLEHWKEFEYVERINAYKEELKEFKQNLKVQYSRVEL